MRVMDRHIKALERQIQVSVLIEKGAEVKAECLNLKSEWAGSKIPGLRVNNLRGVLDIRVRDEGGENEIHQYIEAVRRGCKRLAYRIKTNEALQSEVTVEEDEQDGGKLGTGTDIEEEAEPRTKRMRKQGPLGEG